MSTSYLCPKCGKVHVVTDHCNTFQQRAHLSKSFHNSTEMAKATDEETRNIALYNIWRDGGKK